MGHNARDGHEVTQGDDQYAHTGPAKFGWAAAMHVVAAGATVVGVPPLMNSRERLSRPGRGKTDPVDAVATARITARESFLPPVRPRDGLPAELRVLMDYREQLIDGRTALANRIQADLGWLGPGYQRQTPPGSPSRHTCDRHWRYWRTTKASGRR